MPILNFTKANQSYNSRTHSLLSVLSVLLFVAITVLSSHIALALEKQDCVMLQQKLSVKSKHLDTLHESIQALLNSQKHTAVPLTVLFQVDLKNEQSVAKRVLELTVNNSEEALLNSVEYLDYKDCAHNEPLLDLLNAAVQKQLKLNALRLHFLRLPVTDRATLIAAFDSAKQQSVDKQAIDQHLLDSQTSLALAKSKLIENESDVTSNASPANDVLVSAETLLNKRVVEIEAEHITFIESIKVLHQQLDQLRLELAQHVKQSVAKRVSADVLVNELTSVDLIWRTSTHGLVQAFTQLDISSALNLPPLQNIAFTNPSEQKRYVAYAALHQKTALRVQQLITQRQNLLLDLKTLNFRLVSESGQLRSDLLEACRAIDGCGKFGKFNEATFTGIATELRVMPIKFLAGGINKFVEFKAKINGSIDGLFDVARQSLIFVVLIFLPFLAHKSLRWLSRWLDRLREKVLARSVMDYKHRTRIGLWIGRLNPFVPSAGMILSIHIARALIEATDIQEISYLLFYLELFFMYKAVSLLLKTLMEILFSSKSLAITNEFSIRAEYSATRLSRFFFLRYAFLHIVEDTVRRSLVYHIAYETLFWLSLIIVANEIRYWHIEILQSFVARFKKQWAIDISRLSNSRLKLFVLPILLILVAGYDILTLLAMRLIKFDFFKRLVSEVFKKKLEQGSDVVRDLKAPDESYLALFDYYMPARQDFYIDREPLVAKNILSQIEGWLAGTCSDDFVVLVGNRGIGKTTSMRMIFDAIDTQHKKIVWIEPKITTLSALFDWLSQLFDKPIHSMSDFILLEATIDKKMVFVVDDIHNLFVGKIGGFEAYKQFMEIVSLRTNNIFWCLSANFNAWSYLQSVFGKEHCYGHVYQMRMWTDSEIQHLILARHAITAYSHSFDKSIAAYGASNVLGEQIEIQFFRLLWGQSRGNPRSALMYWISAVSQISHHEIHVGVPKFINAVVVGSMSNDALVILAALSRHDSLTMDELFEITHINPLVIRKVTKECLDKELVWTDAHYRIRISSRAQNAIDYYLIGKNFLYE